MRPHSTPLLLRYLLTLAALLLLAAPARAEREAPRFEIESIRFEEAETLSPAILLAESRLIEGRSYTEPQLRDAIYRIIRLPMVLDAKPRLARGSQPGRYDLIIEVIETRRWFFGLDLDFTRWSEPVSVDGLDRTERVDSIIGTVGRRFSVGRRGLLFAAIGGEEGTLQAGYTHYDLFGRGSFAAVRVGVSDCGEGLDGLLTDGNVTSDGFDGFVPTEDGCATTIYDLGLDPTYSSWSSLAESQSAQVEVVIPLSGSQSIRTVATRRSSREGLRRAALGTSDDLFWIFRDLEEWHFEAGWVYNTIDDPTFPSAGRAVEASIELRSLEAALTPFSLDGPVIQITHQPRSDLVTLDLNAVQHWPLGHESSISARGQFRFGRATVRDLPTSGSVLLDEDLGVIGTTLAGRYSQFLRQTRSRRHWRQLRWESEVEVFYNATVPDLRLDANPQNGFRVGTGLVYRTPWGLLRLSLSYLDVADA